MDGLDFPSWCSNIYFDNVKLTFPREGKVSFAQ